ncbi:hypothetical protein AKJ09_10368 [Labilithrix luteola]|uniref:DUF1656 domain-containing protein n=1 Tax=Labilithrix luteola TaxID=1391654 RepID=A0A0K1QE66_9BACT|nr:DUF1656 domain-containing protein [Labilithrix luteola]AKV03705.1 hypothetical protein AKJ09_10368 [Labilithrix luteola]
MIHETSIVGLFLSPLLVSAFFALVASWSLRRFLRAFGMYRYVFHGALFDLALYVILWSAISSLWEIAS